MKRRSAQEQELAERAYLLRSWYRWHREALVDALAGVHGNVLERLMVQLKDLRSARDLVRFVSDQNWSAVDPDTRAVALHQINRAITALREKNGMCPIDDALPGEPLNVFQLIRNIIHQFPAPAEKAVPGAVPVNRVMETSNE
jgi:hypothetical protein